MITLTRILLDRSPEETARHLCLSQLDEAAEALERLEAGSDPEALHDFRVALRRLRSQLRAYRPYLSGSKPRKLRARIKTLASKTNAARDAEVSIEWLEQRGPSLEGDAGAGAVHLGEALRARLSEAPKTEELREAFEPLRTSARKALSKLALRLEGVSSTFLEATGKLILEMAKELEMDLDAVRSAEHAEALHRARIAAKRLRYLLEPLKLGVPGVGALVDAMKSLQDCLGELQDTRVLIDTIKTSLETTAREEARRLAVLALDGGETAEPPQSPQSGLFELLKVQRLRRERRYRELEQTWLGASGRAFFAEVESLGERLAGGRSSGKKRRFLLRARPAPLERASGILVRQGWLPGREVREQIRSETAGKKVRRSRIVSVEGRSPVEEALSRGRFEAFWSLTEGRRLERRRFRLSLDGKIWYVDEVASQGLVLAETEALDGGNLPEVIQDVLLREVTGSKKYSFESLAESRAQASSLGS